MTEGNLSPKVKALYDAVRQLIEEGIDVSEVKVSDITDRAGIGKGTAYEYFKNKEEIISSAMFFHIDAICSQIERELCKLGSFSDIIKYILDVMEKEIQKRDCFIKYIHILSDNGMISKTLQQKIRDRNENVCMPEDVMVKLIQIGIDKGEIRETLPRSYMGIAIASKLMVYAIYLAGNTEKEDCSKAQMHKLLCDSLIKELG